MDLRHLRYFVAVAEEGSMTRAAERLGIQQPPLGQQIRLLEDDLQVQLFERRPRQITLSVAGAFFLEEARRCLRRAEDAVRDVRRFDAGKAVISMSASPARPRCTRWRRRSCGGSTRPIRWPRSLCARARPMS